MKKLLIPATFLLFSLGCGKDKIKEDYNQPKVIQEISQPTQKIEQVKIEKEFQPQRVSGVYKLEDVVYMNFHDIDFDKLEKVKVPIPKDLEKKVINYHYNDDFTKVGKVRDENYLRQTILNHADKLGFNKEKIKNISTKEAIELSVKISDKIFSYCNVDKITFNSFAFILFHGKYLFLDEYVKLGKGDCTRYAALTNYTFDFFKEINSNVSRNVYLGRDVGGNPLNHSWNSVIVLEKDKLIVSHIDSTRADKGLSLEANVREDFTEKEAQKRRIHLERKSFHKRFFDYLKDK